MKNIAIIIHAGAGPDSAAIRENQEAIKKGLAEAVNIGYGILMRNGSATEAVEAAVRSMEDNPLFNAGKGSALNELAKIEMCASIMEGRDKKSGAVAIVKNIKNPISLARDVMTKTEHIYLAGDGATAFAKEIGAPMEPDAYFITQQQFEEYQKAKEESKENEEKKEKVESRYHGTVGAVALDVDGNLAAATSTGGTACCKAGRIGDSSMIGIGSYADNETCAVSGTGDGEYLIRAVAAKTISDLLKYKGMDVAEACREFVHKENAGIEGDMGVIALSPTGRIGIEFNSEHMHRAWKNEEGVTNVKIYRQ